MVGSAKDIAKCQNFLTKELSKIIESQQKDLFNKGKWLCRCKEEKEDINSYYRGWTKVSALYFTHYKTSIF